MTCVNDRILHLFDEFGVCGDCGMIDATRANLVEMAKVAGSKAVRCAQTALRYDAPASLDHAAKWASLAEFLHNEVARRTEVHLHFKAPCGASQEEPTA